MDGNERAHPEVAEKDGNPRSELEGDKRLRPERAELEASKGKEQGTGNKGGGRIESMTGSHPVYRHL